jgi:hypothetical protein
MEANAKSAVELILKLVGQSGKLWIMEFHGWVKALQSIAPEGDIKLAEKDQQF